MTEIKARVQAIDLLRGIVMVLMVLDHVRGAWHETPGLDPLDLVQGWPALFLTRWVTHFCAPVFLFLTGLSAALTRQSRGESAGLAARRLLGRGFWLLGLEIVVTSALFGMVVFANGILIQVIGAIGICLVLLAALQYLPPRVIGGLGVAIICLHNLIPDLKLPSGLGNLLWGLLHQHETVPFGDTWQITVLYPVLPWLGVMCLGYGMAELYRGGPVVRRRILAGLGVAMVLGFLVVRGCNNYGDPRPWHQQASVLLTVLDFIKVEKYPPSLDYVLMTLGPALLALSALDRLAVRPTHPLVVFGQAPLFFYVLHLVLIDLSVAVAYLATLLVSGSAPGDMPVRLDLGWVYGIWLVLLPLLWLACRRHIRKAREKRRWWHQLI